MGMPANMLNQNSMANLASLRSMAGMNMGMAGNQAQPLSSMTAPGFMVGGGSKRMGYLMNLAKLRSK